MPSYAEERVAIGDLYSRCAHDMDELDSDIWIDYFTEGAVFESPRFGRFTGREGLRQLAALRRKSFIQAKVRHVISNVVVDVDGARATGECYLCAYLTKFGKTELVAVGGYRDELLKVGGRWFFQSRAEFLDK